MCEELGFGIENENGDEFTVSIGNDGQVSLSIAQIVSDNGNDMMEVNIITISKDQFLNIVRSINALVESV